MTFNASKLLALIAVIIFAIAAVGEWPVDDIEPTALGLAFLAAAFVV